MCNLKSNKTLKEILEYKRELNCIIKKEEVEFVLFPSVLYLSFFYDVSYKIGSQNISSYEIGSKTGEILPRQLKSMHVSYVLINHSESNETMEEAIKKIKGATRECLKVVFCVGEKTKQTMEETIVEIKQYLNAVLPNLNEMEKKNLIFAYEPFWAINKKECPKPEIISNIIKKLKQELEKNYSISFPFLYGGGITPENIANLRKFDNIDGFLLGNCANNPENICKVLDKI